MSALSTGFAAGIEEWRFGPQPAVWDAMRERYAERLLLYNGELFLDAWRSNPYKDDPRIYANMSLLWNHCTRLVDFYATTIYQGPLVAKPGSGAIPIAPDPALTTEQVTALMGAIDILWLKWNWQRKMIQRSRWTVALGDCLTELIDDMDARFVYPRIVWPGYVKEISLDYGDNVRAYTLEHRITEVDAQGKRETYTFRKEVDEQAFRYFREDKPFDYFGPGSAVRPNPYGFVPAVWDRHTVGIGNHTERGYAATDATRQMLFGLNSLFSHSRDYQHKAFWAPIIVSGKLSRTGEKSISLATAPVGTDPMAAASAQARAMQFLEGDVNAAISQAQFDIGQTLAELKMIQDGIHMTHPEVRFFEKLADAANVTGPGADRIILPVKGLVEEARAGHDTGTVHLLQMAISMIGYRVNNGDWDYVISPRGNRLRSPLRKSREAFRPFTLDSYNNEAMGFRIAPRDVVPPSRDELIDRADRIERLQTQWGMEYAGVERTDAEAMLAAKREAFLTDLDVGQFNEDFGGEGNAA